MPITGKLEKATLTEMWPGGPRKPLEIKGQNGPAKVVTVQFNPQTLKLSFSNQTTGGNQSGGSATQFAGQGTTKLSLELWFDVTLPRAGGDDPGGDVRTLTREVAFFLTPQALKDGTGVAPPGVQFQWGTFLFKGTVDSMEETLELFSEDGKPLRAGVTLSLSKQDLNFEFGKPGQAAAGPPAAPGAGGGPAAGTQPLSMAKSGDTVQGMAAAGGVSDWKAVAIANGIENPRRMAPGALLNVSGSLSGSGAASLGLTGGTAATLGASAGVSIGGGASAPGSASASAAVSASPSGAIRVAGSGSGSSGLSASSSLRFTGPLGPSR